MCEMKSLRRVRLFGTPRTVAHQVPLSMGFLKQEYWTGLPLPSPWNRPNPGIVLRCPTLWADSLSSLLPGEPKEYECLINELAMKEEKEAGF